MKRKRGVAHFITVGLCVGMMMGGCSYPLAIHNLDSYYAYGVSSLDKPLKIGIATDANEPETRRLLDGVASALGGCNAQVTMPYQANSQKEVDLVANIDIQTEHKGSGWNFLINWPGFLIFTPAWHGYMYEVKYKINCTLKKASTREIIDTFTIPIALDIRHASTNRTWTEISWLEVSVIAFVGGFVFINYDESVTPLVSDKVENPLGKYIAQEIVKRINASGKLVFIYPKNQKYGLAMPLPQPRG